jgi:16S rRNA (cytidine1402-2'-O)-methyltransferase
VPQAEPGGSGAGRSGVVVLVATPIGNLGDISARAIETLAAADVICCEDTRRSRALLSALGIPGAGRLVSLHEHNESARVPEVLRWVAEGRTVAVVSDAGTPGISDPGALLVAAAAAAGVRVSIVPGPSAIDAALVVSGLATERYCVEGFLPRRGPARRERLGAIGAEQRTTVLLEAPGRLAATLDDLRRACGDRAVVVARELTKLHEEVWRGDLATAATQFAAREVRGEIVVVVAGAAARGPASDTEVAAAVRARLEGGWKVREAADEVAAELGVARRRAYQAALDLRATTD